MPKATIRVLIADDHPIVRKSLKAMIAREADIEVIATVEDGLEAVKEAVKEEPDVIIMDISMPKLDGIRAAGRIQTLNLASKIIMLSMHYSTAILQKAKECGAIAYILKQNANQELIPTIRDAYNGIASI